MNLYRVSKSADNITLQRSLLMGFPFPERPSIHQLWEGLFKADSRGVYSFQAVEGLNCDVVIRADGYNDAVFSVSTMGRAKQEYDVMLSRRGEEYIGKI